MTTGWRGRRVLITGHTGFKGSWLALWLHHLGAKVSGFALPPPTEPSLFDRARIAELLTHVEGDIRDLDAVVAAVRRARPEVVFHLAAQPLVLRSYAEPVETYATNVMGTVHLLEAVRRVGGVGVVVAATTDKCYENREWVWPYRETDAMGGQDPYSSSKGAAELVIAAYRRSYFAAASIQLASVRAGNVIGGGDWAANRLVPDLIRAFAAGAAPVVRAPGAVRPWQHVLDALGGYVLLAERLLAGETAFADAWNFGPADDDVRAVAWIVEELRAAWGGDTVEPVPHAGVAPHEAGMLRLDSSKARRLLGWRPALALDESLGWIVAWHKAVIGGRSARDISMAQIVEFHRRQSSRPQHTRS